MPAQIEPAMWAIIGQWLVYGASLTGAFMAIVQFVKWCRSKTTVAKLETVISQHEEKLKTDFDRINRLENRVSTAETDSEDTHKILQLLLASNNAILQSLINGNNVDGLKKASEDIQRYLTGKV